MSARTEAPDTEAPRIACNIHVGRPRTGQPCNRTAVELLLVRSHGAPWYVAPRCREHPATRDVRLMERADPEAETVIVPLPALAGDDPRDHRCAACGYMTAKCAGHLAAAGALAVSR